MFGSRKDYRLAALQYAMQELRIKADCLLSCKMSRDVYDHPSADQLEEMIDKYEKAITPRKTISELLLEIAAASSFFASGIAAAYWLIANYTKMVQ